MVGHTSAFDIKPCSRVPAKAPLRLHPRARRLGSRILTMESGQVTKTGDHETLMAAGGRNAQLWRTMMHGHQGGEA